MSKIWVGTSVDDKQLYDKQSYVAITHKNKFDLKDIKIIL